MVASASVWREIREYFRWLPKNTVKSAQKSVLQGDLLRLADFLNGLNITFGDLSLPIMFKDILSRLAGREELEVYEQFERLSPDECRKLTAVMLLTDGCLMRRSNRNAYWLVFYGKDIALHQIFKFLTMSGLGGRPSSFLQHHKRCYRTVFERGLRSSCMNALFSLTPSFKTSLGRQEKNEYTMMPKPTLKFLFVEPLQIKLLAFRLAMSADGNVAIINNGNGRLKFRLRLGCAHPTLVMEWQTLIKELGISMNVARDKNTWSGIQGLNTDRKDSLVKFSDYGGFIYGVKAHKSRRYRGFEKNAILFGIRDILTGKSNCLKESIETYEAGPWGSLAYPAGLRSSFDDLPNGT